MKVYTLVGKSGTGKSYNAIRLCREKGIESMIDDGLFIWHNRIIAGTSAKKSETKIGAVKVAIFHNEEIAATVRKAIKKKKPASILILGTSDEMTDTIMNRLEIVPDELERIYIEDITSPEEIEEARKDRNNNGKHVIPVPAIQLKQNFAGYFMDPLRLFRGKEQGMAAERTVVRPTFSYMGDFAVTDRAITDIVNISGKMTPGIARVIYVGQIPSPEAYRLEIAVSIMRGHDVWLASENFQKEVHAVVEKMTAFNVSEVSVEVRSIANK